MHKPRDFTTWVQEEDEGYKSLIKIKLHTPIYGKNNLNLLKEEGR